MADYNAGSLTGTTNYQYAQAVPTGTNTGRDFTVGGSGTTTVLNFQMAWKDVDDPGTVVRIWVATGAPDPNGASYTGPKSGATPISGAAVVASWSK